MPAVGQHGDNNDLPEWSENIRDEIAENPIKYLDRPLSRIRDTPSTTSALIDGIESERRARLWLATERRMGSDSVRDACPRGWVVDRLEARIDALSDADRGGE